MGHCPSYDPLSAGGRQTDTSELGADVRAMAQVYTAEAILALVAIMRGKGQGRERIHAQARAYAASAGSLASSKSDSIASSLNINPSNGALRARSS